MKRSGATKSRFEIRLSRFGPLIQSPLALIVPFFAGGTLGKLASLAPEIRASHFNHHDYISALYYGLRSCLQSSHEVVEVPFK